jgi:NAD(P)-dependent dehydrogenase (short-subunit alcohol dehydrogenase family)
MKLEGQIAIVTGAGRNIGEDTAKLMASEGAKVEVVDMDKARGDRVAAEIVRANGTAAGFVADVASEADVARLTRDVVATWGRIDILVKNAAISDNKHVVEITKDEWDKVIAVTLTGPFLMSQHVANRSWRRAAAAGSSTSAQPPASSAARAPSLTRPPRVASPT